MQPPSERFTGGGYFCLSGAVDALREGKTNLRVSIQRNRIITVEIDKAVEMKNRVDKHLITLADILAR